MTLLFVHGAGGFEQDQGLAAALADAVGADLSYPRLPDDDMSLAAWQGVIAPLVSLLGPGDHLVAHSFGGTALAPLLTTRVAVREAHLLAVPYWGASGWAVQEYEFAGPPPPLPVALHHCADDAIVPFDHARRLAGSLAAAPVHRYETGGHQFEGVIDLLRSRSFVPDRKTRISNDETHRLSLGGMTTAAPDAINLAVIGGDGIGPEVVAEGLKVLDAVSSDKIARTEYDLGARRWHATGETLPDSVLQELRDHDAILLGAIGDPSVPSGVLERNLLLRLRFELDHYVNLRPSKLFPGVGSPLDVERVAPNGIDFVVVREGTEGPYTGNGGALRVRTPHELATEVSVNTRFGAERAVRDAFTRAQARERKHLTLVHKHNVLTHAGHLWRRTVEEVGQEFPEVSHDYAHVDAATIYLTTDPGRFDVIVTDNLFGDIITDLAAAVTGGIGLAASGNINPDRTAPSMFEPVHGSAPDIAGQGKADPTAAILSVALLLAHLGRDDEAAQVEAAVTADLAERGESVRSTTQVGDAIAARLG